VFSPILRRQFARLAPLLLVLPGTLAVVLLLVAPIGDTFSETIGPEGSRLANYVAFFSSEYNLLVLNRTLGVAAMTTLISLTLGFFAATAISRSRGALRQVLMIASVFPLLTGAIVRSFAWMVILGRNGMVNEALLMSGLIDEPVPLLFSRISMVIGLVYLFTPLAILSLVGVLDAIDESVLEASSSLGASPLKVFFQVTLPLAIPGLIVGGVLVFTGSLAAFATARLLGGEAQMILPTLLHEKAMVSFDWTSASTIAVIMVTMTLVIILVANRVARRLNPAMG